MVSYQPKFLQLDREHRNLVLAARIRCIWTSSVALIFWSIGLLFLAMSLSPPIDNPAALGLYMIAPVVFAIPFGLGNSFTNFPIIMRIARYGLATAFIHAVIYLATTLVISIAWFFMIRNNEHLWQSTGIFWLLFTVFFPPAIIGVIGAIRIRDAAKSG